MDRRGGDASDRVHFGRGCSCRFAGREAGGIRETLRVDGAHVGVEGDVGHTGLTSRLDGEAANGGFWACSVFIRWCLSTNLSTQALFEDTRKIININQ